MILRDLALVLRNKDTYGQNASGILSNVRTF